MSNSNPYAAKSVVKKEVEPEVKVNVVPVGTVSEVLAWVDNDIDKAKLALDEEKKNLKRASLLKNLNHIIGN